MNKLVIEYMNVIKVRSYVGTPLNSLELTTADGRESIIELVGTFDRPEKIKLEWLEIIRKISGWRLIVFEQCADIPVLLIDHSQSTAYVSRELLRSRLRTFLTLLNRIVGILTVKH
jgi:hypothetical protein